MNKYINLFFLIFLIGCSTNNEVFWCGDHACVNKKEKEKYFMENMIVEIKNVKNDDDIENSKFDQVIRQADSLNKDKKKYSNLTKKQKKQKIKEEKRLAKLIKKQEQKRIKEEEKIQKQIKKDELLRIKNIKKNAKRLKKEEMITRKSKINKNKNILNKKTASNKKVKKIDVKDDAYKKSSDFLDIVKVIEEKSNTKSFPDINKNFE